MNKVFSYLGHRNDCPPSGRAGGEMKRLALHVVMARNKTEAAKAFGVTVREPTLAEGAPAAGHQVAANWPGTVFWQPVAAKSDRFVKNGEPWGDVVWVKRAGLGPNESIKVHGIEVALTHGHRGDGHERRWGWISDVRLGVPERIQGQPQADLVLARGLAMESAMEAIDREVARLTAAKEALLAARSVM